jgi:hypothetical protein
MHPTRPSIFPAPAASSTRRTAAGVKADRRQRAGLGLDASEDRRTMATAGTANTQNTSTKITYWDPDVFVGCQCSPALASIYVIGGSGFRVLVWSPTA